MKKRMILFSSIISLIALLLLYVISLSLISNENKNKAIEEINIYLDVAVSYFDGDNYEEVSYKMVSLDDDLRITFIDLEGNVIYDSKLKYNIDKLDNHLNREEIINLGEAIIRKSDSTDEKMMYIAAISDNTYLRISFDTVYFTTANVIFAVIAILAIAGLFIIEVFFLFVLSKRMLKPVNQKLNELALVCDNNVSISTDTVDQLPEIIADIKNLINTKISQIKDENIKNETIIQAIDECLILLKEDIVTSVNDKTLNTFKVNKDSILGKNYLYLFRNTTMLNTIESNLKNRTLEMVSIQIENKIYDVSIIPFASFQTLISLKDITEKQKIEQVKKDFFANASHELKSPLTSIIGYEQMILNGIIEDKEEIKAASLRILKEANRMNQIIIDMLELSNLEFLQNYELTNENIANILKEILKSYQTKIDNKNITIKADITDLIINCNRNQIETLLSNVIDNAIKYNVTNGTIDIVLNKDGFIIEDSGIGIPKDSIDRVFERFYRVDKAKSKDIGGTGLGLAIVKHICEKFGYQIILKSELNQGTRIEIKFN